MHRGPGGRGLLHGVHNLLVRRLLLEANGQVHHRDVHGGNAEGHSGEFSFQLGQDGTDGLGGPGGGRDDVGRGLCFLEFSKSFFF